MSLNAFLESAMQTTAMEYRSCVSTEILCFSKIGVYCVMAATKCKWMRMIRKPSHFGFSQCTENVNSQMLWLPMLTFAFYFRYFPETGRCICVTNAVSVRCRLISVISRYILSVLDFELRKLWRLPLACFSFFRGDGKHCGCGENL